MKLQSIKILCILVSISLICMHSFAASADHKLGQIGNNFLPWLGQQAGRNHVVSVVPMDVDFEDEKSAQEQDVRDLFLTRIRNGDLAGVRALYDANPTSIDVDPISEDGDYKELPLYLAIHKGHQNIVDWFLEKDPRLLSKQSTYKTPKGEVDYLLSPVYYALWCKQFGIMSRLYAKGADVHTTRAVSSERVSEGMSLLGFAAIQCDSDALKFLIHSLEWDVNSLGEDGNSALIHSFSSGSEIPFRFLLSVPGIDLNLKNRDGLTPLLFCVKNYDIYWRSLIHIRALIKRGADFSIAGTNLRYPKTPLQIATELFEKLEEDQNRNQAYNRRNNPFYVPTEKEIIENLREELSLVVVLFFLEGVEEGSRYAKKYPERTIPEDRR